MSKYLMDDQSGLFTEDLMLKIHMASCVWHSIVKD
jgi:hypothetical protein